MRPSKRSAEELRKITITRDYSKHAEGSVLVEFGDTKVICTASIDDKVPRFLKDSGQGWITAEYGMLPRATGERMTREASQGRQGGRTMEIQRLIGRSLRAAVDLKALGERTITIDCDVIQADGGTRTAAITGGCVALVDALNFAQKKYQLKKNPFVKLIAAISVGIYQNIAVLDLDYAEDSKAMTDMNVVMGEDGNFIEIQGTGENGSFKRDELNTLLDLAAKGTQELFVLQKMALAD